jgi:hypothetical protein
MCRIGGGRFAHWIALYHTGGLRNADTGRVGVWVGRCVRGRHWWRARSCRSRLCGRSSTKCRIRMVPMWVASTAPFERERAGGRGIEQARKRERESLIGFRESEKARKRQFDSPSSVLVCGSRLWVRVCGCEKGAQERHGESERRKEKLSGTTPVTGAKGFALEEGAGSRPYSKGVARDRLRNTMRLGRGARDSTRARQSERERVGLSPDSEYESGSRRRTGEKHIRGVCEGYCITGAGEGRFNPSKSDEGMVSSEEALKKK